jgi:2'-hydroxyisoflavone reductase
MKTSRREFLQTAAIAATTAGLGGFTLASREDAPQAAPAGKKGLSLLILGGTGFLGPAIVEEAVRRGHKMTLFNRGKTNPDLFPDLEWLKGDRHGDIEALQGRKWDAVIDTSGYVPSHVDATASLLAGNAGQYVFLSSISVYADNSGPGTEKTPVIELTDEVVATMKTIRESLQHYGGMKARCEMAAEAAMPGRVTNVRPGLIVGPMDRSDRFTYWPVRIRRGGEVLAPGDGTDPVQYIDVRDLGDWILTCIENKSVGVFNAVTPAGRFNMAELLHGIKSAFTTDATFTWAGAEFLQAQGINPWSHMPVWIPAQGEYAGFHLHSSEKAVEAGLEFRPLAETARDTLAWFREARPADYEFGKTAGISRKREKEVLEAWRAHLAAGEKEEVPEGN